MLVAVRTKKKFSPASMLVGFAAVAAIIGLISFVTLGTAQGSGVPNGETFGIGQEKSTQSVDPDLRIADKLDLQSEQESGVTVNDRNAAQTVLSQASHRTITVKDPDPVVAFAAVDRDNPSTVAKAEQVGCLHPLPTAPHILPDLNEPGWMIGSASAYDLENNDGWDATASGVLLNRYSVTVAVPISQSHLLGSAVEIVYGDKVVVATITDTGGFAPYGRALDLAGGVWRALGAETCGDWGVRQVHYRFL